MTEEQILYVPNLEHDGYHIIRDRQDIYGLCGEQVDNSNVDGESPITTKKPEKVHAECQKIWDSEQKAAAKEAKSGAG